MTFPAIDVLTIVRPPDISPLKVFQDYVFSTLQCSDIYSFSNKLLDLHLKDSSFAAHIQDIILKSDEFVSLSKSSIWYRIASEILSVEASDILLVFPHFRLDLPSTFVYDEKRISLPWHQEACYYLKRGNCSPKSIVLSTYLHDCYPQTGSILISELAYTSIEGHSENYLDDYNQRFFRVECPEPSSFVIPSTQFGDVIAFDFLRPHKSGINSSNLVRLTFLIRASSRNDIQEWMSGIT